MLSEKQLIQWFLDNGLDMKVSYPLPLLPRLIKKARIRDELLFLFLKESFTPVNHNYVKLKFNTWNELFECYLSSLGAIRSQLEA